jgi:hypothetical protein
LTTSVFFDDDQTTDLDALIRREPPAAGDALPAPPDRFAADQLPAINYP